VRNVSTREYHIYINSISQDLSIHKKEAEKSIIEKFGALYACCDPLTLQLFSFNGKNGTRESCSKGNQFDVQQDLVKPQ